MNTFYVKLGLWVALNTFNAAMLTIIACRLLGRILPAFNEFLAIGTMLAIMIPIGVVVGLKTLHRAS